MFGIPREIPVSELRPGLTIWKIEKGKFIRDVYLADYFYGWEVPPTMTPEQFFNRLEFTTASDSIVTWRNCGKVIVTFGKDDRKIITVPQGWYAKQETKR